MAFPNWKTVDPEEEAGRLAEKRAGRPIPLLDEYHLVTAPDGLQQYVHIAVSTERGPFPVRPDLGQRLADLIRADLHREAHE